MEINFSCLWFFSCLRSNGSLKSCLWSFENLLNLINPEGCLRLWKCWFPENNGLRGSVKYIQIIFQWSLGWETEEGKYVQLHKRGWEDDSHFLESFSNQVPQGQSLSGVAASQLHWILAILLPDSTTLHRKNQTSFGGLWMCKFLAENGADKSEWYPWCAHKAFSENQSIYFLACIVREQVSAD